MTVSTRNTIAALFLFTTLTTAVPVLKDFDHDESYSEEEANALESYYNPQILPAPQGMRDGYAHSSTYQEQDYEGYGTYKFGYKVDDPYTGNHQSRHEEKDDYGRVTGSYSLVEPDGNVRTVYYVADKFGYRAFVKNTIKPSQSFGLPNPGPY